MHIREELLRTSAAYRAYVQLEHLPANATPWLFHSNGFPVVQRTEIFCLYPMDDAGICGARLSNHNNLRTHVRTKHNVNNLPSSTSSAETCLREGKGMV